MNKLLVILLLVVLFSCSNSDLEPINSSPPSGSGLVDQDVVTDASGRQYPFLDPSVVSYCGPGWGRKFCRFLNKYDETTWEVANNYPTDFSDIRFSNFSGNVYFISFFNYGIDTSYCEGWKIGETNYSGEKWNINIKRDEEDIFWFGYDYYGESEEIEHSVTYKYEVINGLLHFSSSDGSLSIFTPIERNYSEDDIGTGEIVKLEGCMF